MEKRLIIIAVILFLGITGLYYLRDSGQSDSGTSPSPNSTVSVTDSENVSTDLFTAPCGYTSSIGQGPYYVSGAPLLTDGNLNYSGREGQTLVLSGYVLEGIGNPQPVANAEIDIWQTDAEGVYHPLGSGSVEDYKHDEIELRGIVNTDENGYYEVKTILPEEYSGRPRHMHVKVRAPGKPELTTQLYWQQEEDENIISDSDVNPESRDCQVLTANPDGENLRSKYDFYLR